MNASDTSRSAAIAVACRADGAMLYQVGFMPAALPPVRPRDLLAGWEAARMLAAAGAWGTARVFRFCHLDEAIDIALVDKDAGCWADAVDAQAGLHTSHGLSLCLRLLALVDVLTRSHAARRLLHLHDGEAQLHPALIAAAARCTLRPDARFAESELLAGLGGACELLGSHAGSTP